VNINTNTDVLANDRFGVLGYEQQTSIASMRLRIRDYQTEKRKKKKKKKYNKRPNVRMSHSS